MAVISLGSCSPGVIIHRLLWFCILANAELPRCSWAYSLFISFVILPFNSICGGSLMQRGTDNLPLSNAMLSPSSLEGGQDQKEEVVPMK